jgi:hypothetical protein
MSSRFSIERVRTDAHDHSMKADFEWQVIDTTSGEPILTFDESYEGASATGAADVTLSEDDREVIVEYHDGNVMRVPLEN